MKFGLFGGAAARLGNLSSERDVYTAFTNYVCEAEELGFKSFFIAEHHFSGISPISAVLNYLCFLAARTTTIRLGTAVSVLPWHNPALLVEQAATLDVLSNGRLDLGLGRGYRLSEFEGFSIPFDEAGERYDECLAFMRKAWSSKERFSFHGKYWKFDNVVVEPAPVQTPHPPFWIGAGSPQSLRAAANEDFNLLLDQIASPDLIGERISIYKKAIENAGGYYHPCRVGVTRAFHLALNAKERELAYEHRAAFLLKAAELQRDTKKNSSLGLPTSMHEIQKGTEIAALIGDVEEIIQRIGKLKSLGVHTILMMDVGLSHEALRVFSNEIIPEFSEDNDIKKST
jgi:alkanesulfonate monooxygenase SsuD/methylene tetrahydromethanopterin reductase-like flavin-dependent oxidoreductase (luciferase family)